MRLQSVILPGEHQDSQPYYRGALSLSAGGILSFDAYYNSFSFTKYRDYTTVDSVSFCCSFAGSAKVELCVFDGEEKVICGGVFHEKASLSADFSALGEKGFLYPRITALTEFRFEQGEYRADCEPKRISCCIAICTYKREGYVLRNAELLRGCKFSFIDRVYIIDNGKTLDAASLSDGFVNVIPNKNYGGSGGFTRGIIAAKDGGFSHVILMDDDVEFHPQTLEQMTVFVSLLRGEFEESWFSAGMIYHENPCCQYELGAEWSGRQAIVHKHNADITSRAALLDNLDNSGVEYGGWWMLLMPLSVTERGLPYPFFIKFDDVEYGMRKPAGTQVITMNGIALRHEAFDKKKSLVLDYYNLRNSLVVNAIYEKSGAVGAVMRFLKEAAKNICLYRYDNIPLVLRAADDFLSGPEFFLAADDEKINGELIKTAPKLIPLREIPQWDEKLRCGEQILDKTITPAMVLTLAGHLIPSFLLKKEIKAAALSRTGAVDCFGRKAVIQYQLGGENGIVTRRSFKKFALYSIKVLGMAGKMFFCYGKAKKSYQARKGELSSESFWRRRLDI